MVDDTLVPRADNTPVPDFFTKDLCNLENHMGVIWDNKIYIVGGSQRIRPQVLNHTNYASRHMRILDFTSSVDISSTDIISTHPVPDDQVPPLKYANLFAGDGKLHLFGGYPEYWGMLHDDGTAYASDYRRPPQIDQLFTYDIQRQEWDVTSLGLGPKTPGGANVAYDEKNEVGWVYGGVFYDEGYYVVNGDGGWVSGTHTKSMEPLSRLIKYNTTGLKAAYMDLPLNPVGHGSWGSMTFIPGVGEEGVLILLGGLNFDNSQKDMGKIHILDIASNTWYTQDASSEGGNEPLGRWGSCTVVVSAPDLSSHNIFMYGGVNIKQKAAYNDIFVLSIPSFHWIYVGDAPVGKFDHTCHKLQERYMVTYRGVQDDNIVTCDKENGGIRIFDMETLEWTAKYEVKMGGIPTYKVPKQLYSIIGGGETGNATFKIPKNGWLDPKLGKLFESLNPMTMASTPTTTIIVTTITAAVTSGAESDSPSDTVPKGAIAGGVIGGIIFLVVMVFALIWFKRKRSQQQSPFVQHSELEGVLGRDVVPRTEMPEPYPIPAELLGSNPAEFPGDSNFTPGVQIMPKHK